MQGHEHRFGRIYWDIKSTQDYCMYIPCVLPCCLLSEGGSHPGRGCFTHKETFLLSEDSSTHESNCPPLSTCFSDPAVIASKGNAGFRMEADRQKICNEWFSSTGIGTSAESNQTPCPTRPTRRVWQKIATWHALMQWTRCLVT